MLPTYRRGERYIDKWLEIGMDVIAFGITGCLPGEHRSAGPLRDSASEEDDPIMGPITSGVIAFVDHRLVQPAEIQGHNRELVLIIEQGRSPGRRVRRVRP